MNSAPNMPRTRYIDVNIIVLDDDPLARAVVTAHIKTAADLLGIKAVAFECASADEAWQVWGNNAIHAIASDVYLGGPITGPDFITAVKSRIKGGRLPVAILTGVSDEFNLERLWTHGWVTNKPLPRYFWKQVMWWMSHMNSFWKGLAYDFPEYEDRLLYSGQNIDYKDEE
jgi:CheY-like chemotaxis protein